MLIRVQMELFGDHTKPRVSIEIVFSTFLVISETVEVVIGEVSKSLRKMIA